MLVDRSNKSSLIALVHSASSFRKKSIPNSSNVIINICATINRVGMRCVAVKEIMGKHGIVEKLRRVVQRTAEFKILGALVYTQTDEHAGEEK